MLTVAVSGINAVDNPGPGTGIARALKESSLDVRIVGLAYDAMEPGIYLDDIIDKTYLMPYPSGDRSTFLERIRTIHDKEWLDIIISSLDAELPLYMDIEKELRGWGIKMLIPTRTTYGLRDKTRLAELAEAIGLESPPAIPCMSHADLIAAVNKIHLPCMIKGPFYEAYQAHSQLEAEHHFYRLVNKWGYPIIVQQMVYGEECDVVGCGDGEGGSMGLFAMKKLTTTALGKVWNAVSIGNEKLLQAAATFVKLLAWRGGFELEVIIEEHSQEIYLLEVNPRFPAWVYMAAACGVNLPERMVRLLLDLDFERHCQYRSGRMLIRYTAEVLRDISHFEQVVCSGELAMQTCGDSSSDEPMERAI